MRKSSCLLVVAAVSLLVGAGCTRSAVVAAAAPVPLNVPPAPPRVISVPPEPVAPVETTTADPPAERRPVRASRPAARPDRGTRTAGATADPEPPPEEAPAPTPATAEPAPPPAPVLRTPQTADESQTARRVREVLGRATTQLDQVGNTVLSREAKTQYDTARRFVEQAQQALIERNLVFASYLADKAETIARGLR